MVTLFAVVRWVGDRPAASIDAAADFPAGAADFSVAVDFAVVAVAVSEAGGGFGGGDIVTVPVTVTDGFADVVVGFGDAISCPGDEEGVPVW